MCTDCGVQVHFEIMNMLPPPELEASAAPEPADESICVITGRSASYRDPDTGLPYADLEAYRELKLQLRQGGARSLKKQHASNAGRKPKRKCSGVPPSLLRSCSKADTPALRSFAPKLCPDLLLMTLSSNENFSGFQLLLFFSSTFSYISSFLVVMLKFCLALRTSFSILPCAGLKLNTIKERAVQQDGGLQCTIGLRNWQPTCSITSLGHMETQSIHCSVQHLFSF